MNTLVALDAPDGSVTVTALQDAVGTGVTPSGGVETGGGGTAAPDAGRGPAALAGLVLAAAVVVPVVARRRTV